MTITAYTVLLGIYNCHLAACEIIAYYRQNITAVALRLCLRSISEYSASCILSRTITLGVETPHLLRSRTLPVICTSQNTRYTAKLDTKSQARWKALLNMQREFGDAQQLIPSTNAKSPIIPPRPTPTLFMSVCQFSHKVPISSILLALQ